MGSAFRLPSLMAAFVFGFLASLPCFAQTKGAKVILVPAQEVVISSRISSTIEEYKVKEGDVVKKGQLLVVMDEKYYRQIYNNTEAALKEAETKKDFATYNYKQKVQLYQRGVVGKMEVEESKLNADLSLTQYNQAQAKLRLAELDLKACQIMAPFDGRIVKEIAKDFEYVRSGEPILRILNDSSLLAVMHFPSSEINKVAKGMTVSLKVSETGKVYQGKVTEISAHIDASSRTFEVKATVPNADGKLRSGMSGVLVK